MNKKALITGITGQDGSYLAELLLEKNYEVAGFGNPQSYLNSKYLKPHQQHIHFFEGSLADQTSIHDAIKQFKPDEVYNLAAQSNPNKSWKSTLETAETNGFGAHRLFDAVKLINPHCKIYQASSSELYGAVTQSPQNEHTPFNPSNPYAAAKLYAHNIAKIYRNSYQMFIACGILFNHESPRRPLNYIIQKIAYAAACIQLDIANSPDLNEEGEPIVKNYKVALGNLEAKRDWGYAKDYVDAMQLMLQQDRADDFVIGTGISHSIKQACDIAFSHAGLNWQEHVYVDNRFLRPLETGTTVADYSKAKQVLGWLPKTNLQELIATMIESHVVRLKSL